MFGEAFGHALTTGAYSKCWPRSRLAKTDGLGSLWYSSGDTIPNSEKLSMVSPELLVYRKLDGHDREHGRCDVLAHNAAESFEIAQARTPDPAPQRTEPSEEPSG